MIWLKRFEGWKVEAASGGSGGKKVKGLVGRGFLGGVWVFASTPSTVSKMTPKSKVSRTSISKWMTQN